MANGLAVLQVASLIGWKAFVGWNIGTAMGDDQNRPGIFQGPVDCYCGANEEFFHWFDIRRDSGIITGAPFSQPRRRNGALMGTKITLAQAIDLYDWSFQNFVDNVAVLRARCKGLQQMVPIG